MSPVTVDDVPLAYEETGNGPPVVLVHGTAANQWGELPALLETDHRVIAYDRRSFGRSQAPAPPELSRHAQDLAALVRELGAVPVKIVGWSAGGIVALEFAVSYPELVSGLVLVEPPLYAKRRPTLRQARAVLTAQLLGRLGRDRRGAEAFLRWAGRRADGGTDLDRMSPIAREELLANASAIVRELGLGTGEHLTPEQLGQIRAPAILLIATESEPAFHRAGDRLVEIVPAPHRREVERSGHFMQLDRPDAIATAVREVVAKSPA